MYTFFFFFFFQAEDGIRDLYVTGVQTCALPISLQAAKNVLGNEGLQVRLGAPAHNPLPKGEVIKATPGTGSRLASGSPVTLIVSLGPRILEVPNVSGQAEATARATLKQQHLRIGKDKP